MSNLMIKTESISNKSLKRLVEHSIYLTILFVLVPAFFYFELAVVLPVVSEQWSSTYFIHLICATFLLVNVIGNMMYGMLTDTSIKGTCLNVAQKETWSLCSVCECVQPPRTWHCDTCNICILKRDHHCTFFACCVGYFNFRYFMCFVFHIFVSMLYAFYFNCKFLSLFLSWNQGLTIMKFIFPLASFVIDFSSESVYIFLIVINVIVGLFTGFLFFYHLHNILHGKTTPEAKICDKDTENMYDHGWKSNLVEVFGYKWYLTWLSPFIKSPLPGNGIEWECQLKHE